MVPSSMYVSEYFGNIVASSTHSPLEQRVAPSFSLDLKALTAHLLFAYISLRTYLEVQQLGGETFQGQHFEMKVCFFVEICSAAKPCCEGSMQGMQIIRISFVLL